MFGRAIDGARREVAKKGNRHTLTWERSCTRTAHVFSDEAVDFVWLTTLASLDVD